MSKKCRYTALSRAKTASQVSFRNVEGVDDEPESFIKNIKKKISSHKRYDMENGYETNIEVEDIQDLYVRQNGSCVICDCYLNTFNYKPNDEKQFSIDRLDSRIGHIKGNMQLLCWGCNKAKGARF